MSKPLSLPGRGTKCLKWPSLRIASNSALEVCVAVSAAVAWGNFNHNSNAYIGGGTTINAANIAVDASTSMPITNTWLKWDGLTEVLGHLNGNLGVGGNILTSYANATADAGDTIAVAGSMNHFVVNNNTTAWVAGSASLTATCTTACGSSATVNNGDVHTYDASSYIDSWIAVTDPPNWSPDDTLRLKKRFLGPSRKPSISSP